MISILLGLLFLSSAFAIEMKRSLFCQNQQIFESQMMQKNVRVEGKVPHPALLATINQLISEFEIAPPLVLHFTDYQGPRKVWSLTLSKEKHLYFAKNAIDLLLGLELQKVAAEVCGPNWSGSKTFHIVYTNTVLEQFLRHAGSAENLAKILEKKTGWKLRVSPGELYYEEEQDFRTEELITLIKQLMDLPADVFKKMKIKKFNRWRIGGKLPIPGANAIYYPKEEKIHIADGALMDDSVDLYGEGALLHELGHAYWFGSSEEFRLKFSEISWAKKNDKWYKKSQSAVDFISDYAMTSPEEDFAEHFSAYIHRPEFLKRKSLVKYEFLAKSVFTDTSYFSTVAQNAKVFIESPTPDTKDPWLEEEFDKSYKASANSVDGQELVSDIRVEVLGAKDDISGIDSTLLVYEHVENDNFQIFIDLHPEKKADGSTSLIGQTRTNPKELATGLYQPKTFCLKDKAGNKEYYETRLLPPLEMKGHLSLNVLKREEVNMNEIKLMPAPPINGYPGVTLTLPVTYKESMKSIHFHWELSEIQQKTVHVCNLDYRPNRNDFISCIVKASPGEPLQFQFYFFKQYPNSLLKLASFDVLHKNTQTSAKIDFNYIVPEGQSNASTRINTGNEKMSLLDLDVNAMKLVAVNRANDEGGNQNIEVMVPLVNHGAGEFYICSTVRSPTGKRIISIVGESDRRKFEVISVSGTEFLKFNIPLKKNPEEGEYLIEGFELKTVFEKSQNPTLPLDQNEASTQKIKLIERGIRKTFTITDDKIINLN